MVLEFINLCEGNMGVKGYSMKFTQLSKAPTMFAKPMSRMSKIVSGDSNLVVKECLTTMLVN